MIRRESPDPSDLRMCIRAQFAEPMLDVLVGDGYVEPRDSSHVVVLFRRVSDDVFGHPRALAFELIDDILMDLRLFSMCARRISPYCRAFKRLRQKHGDLFAGTAAALPPISTPALPPEYRRLERPRLSGEKELNVPVFMNQLDIEFERDRQDAIRRSVAHGERRHFGPGVVDLVPMLVVTAVA
jgi:hypothetical protein